MGSPLRQAKTAAARKRRVSAGTVARELTVLQAAINAYHAEYVLDAVPIVTMPETPAPRDRWLTRKEVARFLRATRHHPDKAARTALIRFFLIGLYTGTRSGAVRLLAWMPTTTGGWVDLEHGVMHRRAEGAAESKKRRPPIRIPTRLLGHLRRWQALDGDAAVYVVRRRGEPLFRQRRSWEWVRKRAGMDPGLTPHILRHTAATWMMQGGINLWDAAGFLGMSPEILWRVYGHHHPDWQRDIATRIGRKPGT